MLRWPFLFVGNSHEFQLMGLGDHIAAVVGRLRVKFVRGACTLVSPATKRGRVLALQSF